MAFLAFHAGVSPDTFDEMPPARARLMARHVDELLDARSKEEAQMLQALARIVGRR